MYVTKVGIPLDSYFSNCKGVFDPKKPKVKIYNSAHYINVNKDHQYR